MENKMEDKITISRFEYDNLNRIMYKYELILNVIFNNTYLNYSNELDYDISQIDKILHIIEPKYYTRRLKQLNHMEEKEENNNDTN